MAKVFLNLIPIVTLKGLAVVLVFPINFLLVRFIGVDDFGRYSEFCAMVMIVSIIGRLGFETIVVRELARNPVRYSDKSLISTAYIASITGTLLTAIIVFLVAWYMRGFSIALATLGGLAAIGFSIKVISSHILRGRKFAPHSTIFDGVALPLVVVVALLIPDLVTTKLQAATLFTTAICLVAILSVITASRFAIEPFDIHGETAHFFNFLESIKHIWPTTILGLAAQRWIPLIILGLFGSSYDIAVYAIAFQLANLVIFCFMASNVILAPRYSELSGPVKRSELGSLIRRFYRFNVLVAFLIAAPLIIFAEQIMMIYSSEFTGAGLILIMLVCGQVFSVLGGNFGLLLSMTHYDRANARNAYFGYGILIVMSLFLAHPFGAIGISVAFMISSLFLSINGNILLQKNTGIRAVSLF